MTETAEIKKRYREAERRIEKRASKYRATSTLKDEQAKRDIAYHAACLFAVQHKLTLEKLAGIGKSEETRTITSIAGAYRRAMIDLGLTTDRVDTEEEAL